MENESNVTMEDIARHVGVTKATVSMVFRNRPGISDGTRERVLTAANKFNYSPSTSRQRRGRVHHAQLGLLFITENTLRLGVEPGAGYLLGILRGVQHEAESGQYSVTFSTATCDHLQQGKVPAALWRQGLDGLLVRGPLDDGLSEQLKQKGIRYALVDCASETPGHDVQVNIDNIGAMEMLVKHLYDQGCRKFATITGDLAHINGLERLAGLHAALLARGLGLPKSHVAIEPHYDEESGRLGAETLCNRGIAFDALVCQNDLLAAEAMKVLAERGIRVPGDVKVTGFDNMSFASMLPTPLTSVDSKPASLGRMGVQLLLSQMEKDRPHAPLCVRVPAEVVVRASSMSA